MVQAELNDVVLKKQKIIIIIIKITNLEPCLTGGGSLAKRSQRRGGEDLQPTRWKGMPLGSHPPREKNIGIILVQAAPDSKVKSCLREVGLSQAPSDHGPEGAGEGQARSRAGGWRPALPGGHARTPLSDSVNMPEKVAVTISCSGGSDNIETKLSGAPLPQNICF